MIESKTTRANDSIRAETFWIEYGAALWAFIFALLHVAWAAGWYIGLDEETAGTAFARRWFLIYNLIAAGLCFFAVAAALAPVQFWGRRLPRRLVGTIISGAAAILILRGGAAVIKAIYPAINGGISSALPFWDWWFCLGAALFAVSAWRFWRK